MVKNTYSSKSYSNTKNCLTKISRTSPAHPMCIMSRSSFAKGQTLEVWSESKKAHGREGRETSFVKFEGSEDFDLPKVVFFLPRWTNSNQLTGAISLDFPTVYSITYFLGGGNSNIVNFHPDPWGNDPI